MWTTAANATRWSAVSPAWSRPGCFTSRPARTPAGELAQRGRPTAAYHAGLRGSEREEVHERFLDGQLDVVVATSAFGIDKADVRFVAHASTPGPVDS